MTDRAFRAGMAPDLSPPPAVAQPLFHRVLIADQQAVRQVLTDLNARLGPHLSADVLGRLELVLAEVMNNIVLHGGGTADAPTRGGTPARHDDPAHGGLPRAVRRIHLSAACHRNGVACAVTDDGVGVPPDCLIGAGYFPDLTGQTLPEGGFGWPIIHDLTRSLAYFREDRRNLLAFNIPAVENEGR